MDLILLATTHRESRDTHIALERTHMEAMPMGEEKSDITQPEHREAPSCCACGCCAGCDAQRQWERLRHDGRGAGASARPRAQLALLEHEPAEAPRCSQCADAAAAATSTGSCSRRYRLRAAREERASATQRHSSSQASTLRQAIDAIDAPVGWRLVGRGSAAPRRPNRLRPEGTHLLRRSSPARRRPPCMRRRRGLRRPRW